MKTENLGHKTSKEGRDYMDLLQSSSMSHDNIPGPRGLGLYARQFLCVKHRDSQGDPRWDLPFQVSLRRCRCCFLGLCWSPQLCFTLFAGKMAMLASACSSTITVSWSFWSPIEAFCNLCFCWTCVYFTEDFPSHHITCFCLCVPLSHDPAHSWCSMRICWMSDH